jgi:methyl-accepting chemotaxis protein
LSWLVARNLSRGINLISAQMADLTEDKLDIDIAENTSQIIQGLSSALMTDSDNLNTPMDSLIDDIRKNLHRKYKS